MKSLIERRELKEKSICKIKYAIIIHSCYLKFFGAHM